MAEWIKIRIKDYYQNIPIEEEEYTYVGKEVYHSKCIKFSKKIFRIKK